MSRSPSLVNRNGSLVVWLMFRLTPPRADGFRLECRPACVAVLAPASLDDHRHEGAGRDHRQLGGSVAALSEGHAQSETKSAARRAQRASPIATLPASPTSI